MSLLLHYGLAQTNLRDGIALLEQESTRGGNAPGRIPYFLMWRVVMRGVPAFAVSEEGLMLAI